MSFGSKKKCYNMKPARKSCKQVDEHAVDNLALLKEKAPILAVIGKLLKRFNHFEIYKRICK
jgi:hypothetical protein